MARRLIEKDRVRYLLGAYSADVTAAVATVAERHKLPIISPQGTGNSLYWREPHYHFGLVSANPDHFRLVLELALKVAAAAGRAPADFKAAVVVENDPFFNDNGAGLRSLAKQLGMDVVVDGPLTEKSADNRALFAKIKAAAVDLLIVSAHARLTQEAVRTISELEMQVPMVAMSDCEAADITTSMPQEAEHIVCVGRYTPPAKQRAGVFGSAPAFREKFTAQYGDYANKQLPDEVGQAAAAVLVFARAFQGAATLDPTEVRDTIAKTEMDTFVGRVKFARDGRNQPQMVMLSQIQDGRYRIVAPAKLATGKLQWPRPVF
jgi:branched-chain amino acid transport system substrate-binding protein